MPASTSTITTAIWHEQPQATQLFQSQRASCYGYDLHASLMPRASLAEMLLLLFTGEQPCAEHAQLLNALAVGLANPGPRDASVHAAMAAGATGAPAASALMAALGVGAGRSGGAREVFDCMRLWQQCGPDAHAWAQHLGPRPIDKIWPAVEHAPGFDAVGSAAGPLAVKTLLALTELPGLSSGQPAQQGALSWLARHHAQLEQAAGGALSHTLVAAMTFIELGLNPSQGEMLYLLLRLPGAAAHALEQSRKSYTEFPFPRIELVAPGELL